jgi:hypothetical protein
MCFLWGTNSTFCPESVSVCSVWFYNKQRLIPKQHYPVVFCSGDIICFVWGTNSTFCTHSLSVRHYRSHNKKWHFPQAALTGWALLRRRNMFPSMYNQYILPTKCICVFRMVLTINSESFPKHHYPVWLCSGDIICFLWGANYAFWPHSVSVCSVWFSQ